MTLMAGNIVEGTVGGIDTTRHQGADEIRAKPEGLGGKAGRNRAVGAGCPGGKLRSGPGDGLHRFAGPSRGGGVLYYHSCEGVKAWFIL